LNKEVVLSVDFILSHTNRQETIDKTSAATYNKHW